MNTRRVNSAAGVIGRAMENGRQTPAGWAMALESAQMLMSPEMAAEMERLRQRVAELESELAALTAQGEMLRATHFTEAARLLEDTGRDDDAVNLLDIVAAGIQVHAAPLEDPHDSPLHHTYRIPRDLPPLKWPQ